MLIIERIVVLKNVTTMAFKGRSFLTVESQGLNGKPLSLANAKHWREAVDTAVKLETNMGIRTKTVIAVAAAVELVAFRNTWMKGIPVGDARTLCKSPRQKQSVMIIIHPRPPLTTVPMIMDLGRVLPASLSSSATWWVLLAHV